MSTTIWEPGTTGYPQSTHTYGPSYMGNGYEYILVTDSTIRTLMRMDPFANVGDPITAWHINSLRYLVEQLETHIHTIYPESDQQVGNTADVTGQANFSTDFPSSKWTGQHFLVIDSDGNEISLPTFSNLGASGNYRRNDIRVASRVVPDLYSCDPGSTPSDKKVYYKQKEWLTTDVSYATSSTPVVNADAINANHINELRSAVETLYNHYHEFNFRSSRTVPLRSPQQLVYWNKSGITGSAVVKNPFDYNTPSNSWFDETTGVGARVQNNVSEPTAVHLNQIRDALYRLFNHRHHISTYSHSEPDLGYALGEWRLQYAKICVHCENESMMVDGYCPLCRGTDYYVSDKWVKSGHLNGELRVPMHKGMYCIRHAGGIITGTPSPPIGRLEFHAPNASGYISTTPYVPEFFLYLGGDCYVHIVEPDSDRGDNSGEIWFYVHKEIPSAEIPNELGWNYR